MQPDKSTKDGATVSQETGDDARERVRHRPVPSDPKPEQADKRGQRLSLPPPMAAIHLPAPNLARSRVESSGIAEVRDLSFDAKRSAAASTAEWFVEVEAKRGRHALVLEVGGESVELLVVDGRVCFAPSLGGRPLVDPTFEREDPELFARTMEVFKARGAHESLATCVLTHDDLELTPGQRNVLSRQLVRLLMRAASEGREPRWADAPAGVGARPLAFEMMDLLFADRPLTPLDGAAAVYFGAETGESTRWLFRRARNIGLDHWISATHMPTLARTHEVASALNGVVQGTRTVCRETSIVWATSGEECFVAIIDADYVTVSLHDARQAGLALLAAVRVVQAGKAS